MNACHETSYGTAAISWRLTDDGPTAEVTVPSACTGTVQLPECEPLTIGPGTHTVDTAEARRRAA
ncbi:alpha-L-rhamnosidase C-terminal domain-containing protein [Streptomyces sp. NPDC050982]|uniref:alpha-L-rhamnosidase C-terminal domain-containing protein n=1 Tax=Streptomyces sp. NPDC050982 TaxID=3154746 RepID=UPI003411A0CA